MTPTRYRLAGNFLSNGAFSEHWLKGVFTTGHSPVPDSSLKNKTSLTNQEWEADLINKDNQTALFHISFSGNIPSLLTIVLSHTLHPAGPG